MSFSRKTKRKANDMTIFRRMTQTDAERNAETQRIVKAGSGAVIFWAFVFGCLTLTAISVWIQAAR